MFFKKMQADAGLIQWVADRLLYLNHGLVSHAHHARAGVLCIW